MDNTVLIVDEHPIVRLALHSCLLQNDLAVVAQARDGIEAMQRLHQHQPHLLIIEHDLPVLSGLVVLEHIKTFKLPTKVVVFSAHDSRLSIVNCFLAGAQGFVSKTEELTVLLKALQVVRDNLTFYPDWVQHETRLTTPDEPMKCLSERERQVLQLLTQGLSNTQIAARMQLSHKTVSTFKTRSLRKLNALSVVEIMQRFK